jgi:hypothetical protein
MQRTGCSVTRCNAGRFADDESGNLNSIRLHVELVHTIVSDVRGRHRHQLATVRWVRQDFLIAGHRRVEDDLAH